MDFARIRDLLAACSELLRLAQLAEIFAVHRNTVEHWIKAYGFPSHIKLNADLRTATRYWRPDQVLEWVDTREKIDTEGIDIDAVCAIVGMHPDTWYAWIKGNRAPGPVWRALRTGRDLWDRASVRAWLNERTGGYALPPEFRRARHPPRSNDEKADDEDESPMPARGRKTAERRL